MFPKEPGEDHGEADISLQLVERTMVEQIFTLQPTENSTLAQVDMAQRKLHPWRALTGTGLWKKLWSLDMRTMLEQVCPEALGKDPCRSRKNCEMKEMAERNCNELTDTPILLPLSCSMGIWDGGGRGCGKGEVETGKRGWRKAVLVFLSLFHTFQL